MCEKIQHMLSLGCLLSRGTVERERKRANAVLGLLTVSWGLEREREGEEMRSLGCLQSPVGSRGF